MSIKVQSLGSAGSAIQLVNVSSSTNATPIVVTLAAGHGLKDGDRIAIAGVTGNTGANGIWTLGSVAATTATLLGSVGNGTHGGTVRVGVVFDKTPFMQKHSGELAIWGNAVGTLDIENYASLSDFAAGTNADGGAAAPVLTPSLGTNSAGSGSAPAKTTVTLAATNAGAVAEFKPSYIVRAILTAYTSGTAGVAISA